MQLSEIERTCIQWTTIRYVHTSYSRLAPLRRCRTPSTGSRHAIGTRKIAGSAQRWREGQEGIGRSRGGRHLKVVVSSRSQKILEACDSWSPSDGQVYVSHRRRQCWTAENDLAGEGVACGNPQGQQPRAHFPRRVSWRSGCARTNLDRAIRTPSSAIESERHGHGAKNGCWRSGEGDLRRGGRAPPRRYLRRLPPPPLPPRGDPIRRHSSRAVGDGRSRVHTADVETDGTRTREGHGGRAREADNIGDCP